MRSPKLARYKIFGPLNLPSSGSRRGTSNLLLITNLDLLRYSDEERDGWVSIRGKRGFNSGIHSIDFNVIKLNSANVSVGVMQQDWEPRIWNFLKDETQHKTCIWTDGMYGDCTHIPFSRQKPSLIISFSKSIRL